MGWSGLVKLPFLFFWDSKKNMRDNLNSNCGVITMSDKIALLPTLLRDLHLRD